ncbi:MAG TPA: RDD family protein [Pseudonocardiaceae bacterium]|nr:RDD family protein [Pseudonocardiaceae bacterium]
MSYPTSGGQQYSSQQPSAAAVPADVRPGMEHGSDKDPRYPSPRRLRRALGFTIDFVLHAGVLVGAGYLSQRTPALANLAGIWALVAWMAVSFVHRVLIQWPSQTTLGKAIFGLCLIRKDDGGRPRFGQLVKAWFAGIWAGISLIGAIGGSGGGGDGDIADVFLPAVRRRDVRSLRYRRGV